jgi:uncharacterized protein (TIGR02597 family)
MKITALRSTSLALGLALIGSLSARVTAQSTATTDPVGFYTVPIVGGTDNVISLPMIRDAVFVGTVGGAITANSFDALQGAVSPAWTVSQFKYVLATQPQTFYVEFTSGALRGLFFKIDDNDANTLNLDTEGDSLNVNHTIPGNTPSPGQLAVGDSFKVRPYWRVKDVFEVAGAPIIEPYPFEGATRDDILIPNYSSVAINKAPNVILYYLQGVGWQKAGNEGEDYGNFILRPNEAFVVRRRNAGNTSITNLGGVLMNKAVTFLPGGSPTSGNDTYFSLSRPAPVTLDASGLAAVMTPSPAEGIIEDQLLAFSPGTGLNRVPSQIYYFLAGQPAGQGWRKSGDDENLTIGQSVTIEPGKVYVLRKKVNSPGKDWVNTANY